MKKFSKLALTAARIMEVIHWGAALFMAGVLVCALANGPWFQGILEQNVPEYSTVMSVYGFEMEAETGRLDMRVLSLFSAAAVVILSLMAMVCRNLRLILRKSEGATPFQPDNIRMVREIGIFYVSVPLIGLAVSNLARVIFGADALEISVDYSGLMTGLVVLCLARFFARGMELERDLDGLM